MEGVDVKKEDLLAEIKGDLVKKLSFLCNVNFIVKIVSVLYFVCIILQFISFQFLFYNLQYVFLGNKT